MSDHHHIHCTLRLRRNGNGILLTWVPGATKLDHLQPFETILLPKFFNFWLSYWGAHSYYPRGQKWELGECPLSQYGWDWGVSVPGAFKLDHLQPFKPILFWNFSNFFTFILGSPFLLPQRANYGSWENFPFPIWIRLRGFSAWGIQTGLLAAL